MSDEVEEVPRTYSGALLGAIAVAVVLGIAGLIWCATLSSKLTTQQTELADAKQQNVNLKPLCARPMLGLRWPPTSWEHRSG